MPKLLVCQHVPYEPLGTLEVLGGEVDPVAVRAETRERIADMQATADRIFGEFARLLGAKPSRVRVLPSR